MTEGPVRGEPIEERPDLPLAPDELRVELAEELAGDLGTDPVADASIETMAGGTNARASVMRSSLLMGTGTVLSRFGGVLRGIFLAAALGAGTVADMFNLGNTLPNVVYILVIGGALNAVFIPELVRHMKSDDDDGQGYANSLITLVGSILLAVSLAAVVIAPWIVRIYATPQYTQSQLDLATAFARFCLPQIFFYGVYTMLSQVLNARGHFGAPTFAPLVNNIIAIATMKAITPSRGFITGPNIRAITPGRSTSRFRSAKQIDGHKRKRRRNGAAFYSSADAPLSACRCRVRISALACRPPG